MDRRNRRGNYAVLTALCLMGMLAFGTIAIDLPYGDAAEIRLQAQLDAMAHAAALKLDGTDEGVAAALVAAQAYATANPVPRAEAWDPGKMRFGSWSEEDGFVESFDVREIWAVEVRGSVEIPPLLSGITAGNSIHYRKVGSSARNRGSGASEVECFLPLAMSTCLFDVYGEEGLQYVDLFLRPPSIRNIGWARPAANVTSAWVLDQFEDCEQDGPVSIGDTIRLTDPTIGGTFNPMGASLPMTDTSWEPSVWGPIPPRHPGSVIPAAWYGITFEAPILLFNDSSFCMGAGGSWSGSKTVTGFTWGAIYDITFTGIWPTLWVRVDTERKHREGTLEGGPNYGVLAPVRISLLK